MADPLRALYLTVGVRGGKRAITDLTKVQNAANLVRDSFIQAASAANILRGALSFRSGGLATQATQATAAVRKLRRETEMTGRTMQRTARHSYGLGTSLFLAYAGGRGGAYAFQQGATLQRQSLLASYASGTSRRATMRQTRGLARGYNMRLTDAAALTREVAQLGAPAAAQGQLARAGAGFNVLESSVSAADASSGIYRLIKATSRTPEEFDKATAAATRYAGAIFAAGNQSAAGAGAVFEMVKELGPLSQFMNLGAAGTIALSAAFADLNEQQRELFRGALTRLAGEGIIDPNNPIGSLRKISAQLQKAGDEQERSRILKSLGFDNIRDKVLIASFTAGLTTFDSALAAVNEELYGTSQFGSKVNEVLHDLQGNWDGLKSSMDLAAATIVGTLTPAIAGLMSMLKGLALVVANNPALAGILGGMAAFYGVKGGASLVAQYGPGFMRGGASRVAGLTAGDLLFAGSNLIGMRGMGAGMRGRSMSSIVGGRYKAGMASRSWDMLFGRSTLAQARAGAGMEAIGGRFGGRLAGRMMGGAVGRAGLSAMGGPVGWIIGAVSILQPVFGSIGSFLDNLGDKGGVLGLVAETLGVVFRLISAIGKGINAIFGWLWGAIKKLLDVLHINDVATWAQKGLDKLTGGSQSKGKRAGDATPKAPGGPTTFNLTVNATGGQTGVQLALEKTAYQSAFGAGSAAYGG